MPNKKAKNNTNEKILYNALMRKPRTQNKIMPPYIYIVSEGTKTEPNYIKELAEKINSIYYDFYQGKRIIVEGSGRNTKGLLEYAIKRVEDVMPQAEIVWLLYDKDDFPLDNFDNTKFSTETRKDKRKYRAIWSNECFELWLVLHFQELDTDTGRAHLRKLLKKHMGKYEKNMPNIYSLLADKTQIAIKRAEKLFKNYDKNLPPSKMCPCTMVFELVKELYKYI